MVAQTPPSCYRPDTAVQLHVVLSRLQTPRCVESSPKLVMMAQTPLSCYRPATAVQLHVVLSRLQTPRCVESSPKLVMMAQTPPSCYRPCCQPSCVESFQLVMWRTPQLLRPACCAPRCVESSPKLVMGANTTAVRPACPAPRCVESSPKLVMVAQTPPSCYRPATAVQLHVVLSRLQIVSKVSDGGANTTELLQACHCCPAPRCVESSPKLVMVAQTPPSCYRPATAVQLHVVLSRLQS
ncbi:hypothetical protein J6590_003350 [Homalodisca vitripennis]|nr:hypothetical protein J6590_003350 [Homalodisca vitripennis]